MTVRTLLCLFIILFCNTCASLIWQSRRLDKRYNHRVQSQEHRSRPSVTVTNKDPLDTVPNGGALSLSLSPEALRIAETIAPKIGVLTSTALYFAPAAAVLSAIRADDIGDLNPFPLAIMSVVSICWLAYGLSVRDPYVALSNLPGCVGSVGYVVGILPLLRGTSALRTTQGVVLAGAGVILSLWTYLGLSGASAARISSSLGLFASALFIVLSGSPLTTIKTVVSSKDSGSILGPLTVAQVINTALWSMYGLAVKDRFVWGPNVVGFGLGLAQLTLKILFPAKQMAAR
eukprot:CAMPEP_0195507818 /NCGR_PEP_ID=MMETSP0794_2-20130614/1185_1 /TAXON_ID=515487 /ORGANISM="Stephanopyxis turris, Strain CCMP 815" /LENGTH=288 /DNA_ID=CAMNT_0040634619 /DNA_START=35 /DNA_END=901 /DNA_ORIENTATION=+